MLGFVTLGIELDVITINAGTVGTTRWTDALHIYSLGIRLGIRFLTQSRFRHIFALKLANPQSYVRNQPVASHQ